MRSKLQHASFLGEEQKKQEVCSLSEKAISIRTTRVVGLAARDRTRRSVAGDLESAVVQIMGGSWCVGRKELALLHSGRLSPALLGNTPYHQKKQARMVVCA